MYRIIIACTVATATTTHAHAAPDKSAFNLFNPTPRELWRDLSADRPDATESPCTVDAGAIQLELSFFEYAYDSHNDDANAVETWTIGADTNVKFGLLHNMDIQFITSLYSEERSEPDAGPTSTLSGFSDLTVRLKVNFWGNEGGKTALGLLPFITIPTGTSLSTDKVAGGIALPFSWLISEQLNLGLMAEIDLIYDDGEDNYDVGFLHTAVLGFEIIGPLGGYVEYVGNAVSDGDYEASFSTGLTHGVTENLILDVGMLVGLTRASDDFTVFTGMTIRF